MGDALPGEIDKQRDSPRAAKPATTKVIVTGVFFAVKTVDLFHAICMANGRSITKGETRWTNGTRNISLTTKRG